MDDYISMSDVVPVGGFDLENYTREAKNGALLNVVGKIEYEAFKTLDADPKMADGMLRAAEIIRKEIKNA